jgi:siroheme synthase (precorrin-2 oxidase/ferrochelatase)
MELLGFQDATPERRWVLKIPPILDISATSSNTSPIMTGWVREQVIQDLPQSHDISAAQQHLKKGAVRELHWHRVAEWGFVYSGSVLISAVDEFGKNGRKYA